MSGIITNLFQIIGQTIRCVFGDQRVDVWNNNYKALGFDDSYQGITLMLCIPISVLPFMAVIGGGAYLTFMAFFMLLGPLTMGLTVIPSIVIMFVLWPVAFFIGIMIIMWWIRFMSMVLGFTGLHAYD